MTTIAIVGEDEGHFRAVTLVVDRCLLDAHAWVDGVLEYSRAWRGLHPGEEWYKYDPADARDVRPLVIDGQRLQPLGHIRGEPQKPEAGMWRRVLLLLASADPRPDAVILARDLDGHPERLAGLKQVRALDWPFPIAAATPEPEIEAWAICGFVPKDQDEKERLAERKKALGFDPTTQSHRLTSHPNDAPTDAKRVLSALTGDDDERARACLNDRALLVQRGQDNYLAAFCAEVDLHITPLLAKAP